MPLRVNFKKIFLLLTASGGLSMTSLPCTAAANATAPISGFAQSFLLNMHLANGTVTVLETGQQFKTDKNGHFGPFPYPVGEPITLKFEKWGYQTTQSSTVIVPPEGLTGPYDNITFQVPSIETYYLLANVIGASIDENSCHITTTITAYHKTLEDVPQGIADATVTITPSVNQIPFYFDIFKKGPLKDKTNPFTRGLTKTSEDGGVALFNLPASEQPYVITAEKQGMKFTESTFICRKGVFINISPPKGPMANA